MQFHRALLLALLFALTACGKKQAPQAPAAEPAAESEAEDALDEEREVNTPDDPDEARPFDADPEEGGE